MVADRAEATDADQVLLARTVALLHANGESTSVTIDAVDRLNRGLGTRFEIVPSWPAVTVLDNGRNPLVATAPPVGVAMRTVAIVMRAVDGIADHTVDRSRLGSELDRAASARPSSLWLFVLACATGPAALSIIFGAHDATAVLLVALGGALGGLTRRLLARVHVGAIGQVFAAAFLAGIIGGLAVNADLSSSLRLIAVCPAMILVPGPHILNGGLDLLALRVTLGFARLGYATVLLVAIGSGLALALALFGTGLPVDPDGRSVPLWLDVAAAGIAAASYPVYFAMPYRLIAFPVVVGAIAHGLRTWAMTDLGVNIALGATIACLLVGLVVAPLSHRLRVPYAAVAFAAVVALVPGVYVFRMINALGELPFGGGQATLLGAVSDGTTAALVIGGMVIGLALPKHVYSRIISRRRATS